ncbi:putative ATP-dependent RNA helicase DHX34 [Portunus trituberculatus]|uniref:Putative ATP-dependent RNA helicase DHX34 n=1 Tax=Portunus trituberculatus TaxID=210409 RepID=A0A5B7E2S1_PORTR|nr:putative ATP-dependent RNA helicase DHX34 [Portunus trituberculatus]
MGHSQRSGSRSRSRSPVGYRKRSHKAKHKKKKKRRHKYDKRSRSRSKSSSRSRSSSRSDSERGSTSAVGAAHGRDRRSTQSSSHLPGCNEMGSSTTPHHATVSSGATAGSDSEDELMFEWEAHRRELDLLFCGLGPEDPMVRGSEQYQDFWAFLKKYHGLHKQRKIREMCGAGRGAGAGQGFSAKLGLPLAFHKRHNINFCLSGASIEEMKRRLPPQDLEEVGKGRQRLSQRRLEEARFVMLLYLDFTQRQRFERLRQLRQTQAELPIATRREELLQEVEQHGVVIVAGDTGCGKSTQVPRYLLDAGYTNVAVTQPRRLACVALARRVAYETLDLYGSGVGYQVRFEKTRTSHTRLVFLTEGLLLRQVCVDPLLLQYQVIILDEVHERHLDTDFLLGVVKVLQVRRPEVRVLLMSATVNLDLFTSYFPGAPVVQVPGRLHPITLKYLPPPPIDKSKNNRMDPGPYVRLLQLIDQQYPADERGDLLVFLSGAKEISTVVEAAQEYSQHSGRWVVLPLHSTLSAAQQERVFHVAPEGVRKCIVSTNIAETSVTIDGVRFVADSGKVKEMTHQARGKMRRLKECWVSQASAEQRKGRAGRTGPGTCFRLYSPQDYESFPHYSPPEVQRVPLDSVVLRMTSMGLPDPRLFPFIEPPPQEALEHALSSLQSQDAIDMDNKLTTLGQLLAQLPLEVGLGKMLIMGALFHQMEPVLSLAAAMSVQSPFKPHARRDPQCQVALKELDNDHGDPFTLLAAYREWLGVKETGSQDSRRWCRRMGLEEHHFYDITKLRHQFSQLLQDSGLQRVAGTPRRTLTSAERAQRHGQLQQLRELRRELHQEDRRPTQVLRIGNGEDEDWELESEGQGKTDIKDVDFRITNDPRRLREILRGSTLRGQDQTMLKVILCCGLYPGIAIADEHNNYKAGSEQLFHTPERPFTVLHPGGVLAAHPEVLQLSDSSILEAPGFGRHPAATGQQLLAFGSVLETHKAFLVDTVRVPAAQTLLLFCHSLDTNADISTVACDSFIELRFPEPSSAQNLLVRAVHLRKQWHRLLHLRTSKNPEDEGVVEAAALERDLSAGLVDYFQSEAVYSQRRLLAADVKVLHTGPGPGDCVLSTNPFTPPPGEACLPNPTKGGVDLTPYIAYNSLLDLQCTTTTINTYDTVCPYCDQDLHLTTLDRLAHLWQCLTACARPPPQAAPQGGDGYDLARKRYQCETCGETLWLTVREIFIHRKSHTSDSSCQ